MRDLGTSFEKQMAAWALAAQWPNSSRARATLPTSFTRSSGPARSGLCWLGCSAIESSSSGSLIRSAKRKRAGAHLGRRFWAPQRPVICRMMPLLKGPRWRLTSLPGNAGCHRHQQGVQVPPVQARRESSAADRGAAQQYGSCGYPRTRYGASHAGGEARAARPEGQHPHQCGREGCRGYAGSVTT
jgi:hypothetical protein